eukprot:ctg_1325.g436
MSALSSRVVFARPLRSVTRADTGKMTPRPRLRRRGLGVVDVHRAEQKIDRDAHTQRHRIGVGAQNGGYEGEQQGDKVEPERALVGHGQTGQGEHASADAGHGQYAAAAKHRADVRNLCDNYQRYVGQNVGEALYLLAQHCKEHGDGDRGGYHPRSDGVHRLAGNEQLSRPHQRRSQSLQRGHGGRDDATGSAAPSSPRGSNVLEPVRNTSGAGQPQPVWSAD